jgi:hypothetical protein
VPKRPEDFCSTWSAANSARASAATAGLGRAGGGRNGTTSRVAGSPAVVRDVPLLGSAPS